MENELQSVERLLEQRETLQHELVEAMNGGSVSEMWRLDSMIRSVGSQLFVAEIKEIKDLIEQSESRRADLIEEIELLRKLKTARNERLNEILVEVQTARAEVGRAEVSLRLAENEGNNLRISTMNLSKRLDGLKQKKIQEINNYEH
jgi:chromosome segregation ATPase